MMTARNRVEPLPTHRLAMRHSVDYFSSDHFTSDDSSRDSPSDSSSETSSNSSSDALSDSSPCHSSSDHSSPALPSGMRSIHQLCSSVPSIPHSSAAITERPYHSSHAGPSRKRSRSPTTSVPLSSLIPEVSSDESSESSVPRENGSRVNVDVEGSDEPYSEPDIDPKVQEKIDKCIAYTDALRARGIDARIVVEIVAREEVEMSARGTVVVNDDRVTHPVVSDDIPEPALEEGAIDVSYEMLGDLRDQGHRIVATSQQGAVMPERISKLEWDKTRLRGMLDIAKVQENEVFQDMQLIQKLRDDQKCMKKFEPSSRSKATEDIISIGSFVEVLVLNHYVLVRKIL
ncbi:hypothetical protein Tco_1049735 [Tanacetum coccineum]